jgi:hypothetical protein
LVWNATVGALVSSGASTDGTRTVASTPSQLGTSGGYPRPALASLKKESTASWMLLRPKITSS